MVSENMYLALSSDRMLTTIAISDEDAFALKPIISVARAATMQQHYEEFREETGMRWLPSKQSKAISVCQSSQNCILTVSQCSGTVPCDPCLSSNIPCIAEISPGQTGQQKSSPTVSSTPNEYGKC